MADWKKLLTQVLLEDGQIDKAEAKLLKREILADGQVDKEELNFLVNLRNKAKSTSPEFDVFFFDAMKSNILADGIIDSRETAKLREILFADGRIDDNEKKFLKQLKKGAKKTCPAFEKLFVECVS